MSTQVTGVGRTSWPVSGILFPGGCGALLPGILNGTIEPGHVFDHTADLDEVPYGHCAMADHKVLKILINASTEQRSRNTSG